VLSGVPQGYVLGPLLFVVYINDIDEQILSKILKFADDTKMYRIVQSPKDIKTLQSDLHRLVARMLQGWQCCSILINARFDTSVSIIHILTIILYGVKLRLVKEEKDLGVTVSVDMKWERQCNEAVQARRRGEGVRWVRPTPL